MTHAISMDGDSQHLASEIPRLIAQALVAPNAIVIGGRRIGNQPVARTRLLGNRVADLAVRLATGAPLPDTQSGIRVYPLAKVLALPPRGSRFEYESAVLIEAALARIPICSVVVDVYYPPVAQRRSHYRPCRDHVPHCAGHPEDVAAVATVS